jgi:isopenicillin N synthase-like dioxygenase
VSIPGDSLAFQLGESMRILSGGCLQATPHSVGTSKELAGRGIARTTIALFMQPDPLQVMKVPEGIDPNTVVEQATVVRPLKNRWQNGITFKEFHYNNFTKFK